MSRRIAVLALLGLLIRLAIAPFTSWSPDMVPWLVRLQEMSHGVALYQHLTFSYPPLFAYMIALFTGPLAAWAGTPDLAMSPGALRGLSLQTDLISATITSPAFNLAVKLPVILCDVGTGLVLAMLARTATGSVRTSELVGLVWFLNPLAIWVCAVHGQFDSIPAFLTVLAMALLWRRQWLGVGVALSLGTLFKLYPAYLLPAAAFFAMLDAWPVLRTGWAWRALVSPLRDVGRLVVGFAIPLVVFLPPLVHSNALTAVFSRGETASVGTGLDLWFPSILPGGHALLQQVGATYALALSVLLYAGYAALLVAAAAGWRADRRRAAVSATAQLLALLLLVAPNTNPQFVIWALPFVILGWGLGGHGRMWLPLSVTPVLFYLAMWALNPVAMLLPAVANFSWPVTAAAAASSLTHSFAQAGPLGTALRLWMMAAVAAAVVVELAWVLVRPAVPVPAEVAAGVASWIRRRRLAMRVTI